jgi:DNA primase
VPARVTQDSKERVRDAVDMAELVGAKTELRRAGGNRLEGLCPFHEERTPSFGIDPSKGVYHCFGCGAGGDVFRFVQETEGVDFPTALEILADRYGVELEREEEDPQEAERRQRRDRLLAILERTAAFYVRVLWESPEAAKARDYLLGRGLDEGVLREFRVGYAPSAWDTVLRASAKAGYGARELYDAGLVQRGQGGGRVYDRFRARITFPLADARGRVLGFGARQLGGQDRGPKYLNTAESELFHKGRIVYGADLARATAAKAGEVVVAEGYTDVIALRQAGVANAVGIMGTALTEQQVGEIRRLAPVAHLALDADGAGQAAMLRAADVAAGKGLELRVVPLPPGQDPADLVRAEGPEGVQRRVAGSMPFVRFRVERTLAAGDLASAEGKDRVLDALRPVLGGLPPSVLREELVRVVADRLDLSEALAATLLAQPASGRPAPPADAPVPPRPPATPAGGREAPDPAPPPRPAPALGGDARLSPAEETERLFLAFCLALPAAGATALAQVDAELHFTSALTRRAALHLRAHLHDPQAGLGDEDGALLALLAELPLRAAREDPSPALLDNQRLQLELFSIDRRMRAARGGGSGESITELAALRRRVQARYDDAQELAVGKI